MRNFLWILIMGFIFLISINGEMKASLEANSFYTMEDFKILFLNELKKELSWVNGTLILENFRVEPENLQIPKKASFKTKLVSNSKLGSNTLVVTFFLGNKIEVVRIWGYVEALVPVVVVKKPLENKSILTEEDLILETKPLSRLPQDVILDLKSVIGKELRMSLKSGTVLRNCHVEEPILIKRNNIINIVAKKGNLVVKAKGKALQNGRVGEMIKIQNLSSKKVLLGKVISSEEVEVSF